VDEKKDYKKEYSFCSEDCRAGLEKMLEEPSTEANSELD
jgi:hypothetical protein